MGQGLILQSQYVRCVRQVEVAPLFRTVEVLGTALAAIDYSEAVALVDSWAADKSRARAVAAANTHVVTLARHDPGFAEALGKFDMVLPDGMPLVWCMNRSPGIALRDRVYGPNFMLRMLEQTNGSHFFLGGNPGLLQELVGKLKARFPRLGLAGMYAPPFGPWEEEEDRAIIETISKSGADFVWVGLGCPKQEQWIARMKGRLPPAVYIGVGAAFAFHAGQVRQAPVWMQRLGLEWLFRLCMEPRRLWRRFVVYNSLFIYYLLTSRK